MSLLFDFGVAINSDLPFIEAWKRIRCVGKKHFHNLDNVFIEKARFENHPHSDAQWIYTVNLMQCKHCSLNFLDDGVERRKPK